MNKFLIFFVLMLATLLVVGGCGNKTASSGANGTGANGAEAGSIFETDTGAANWCPAGATQDMGSSLGGEGTGTMTIVGFKQYKGSSYCYSTATLTTQGQTFKEDLYFKQENGQISDMWVIVKDSTGNVLSETHPVGA